MRGEQYTSRECYVATIKHTCETIAEEVELEASPKEDQGARLIILLGEASKHWAPSSGP